MDTRSRSLAKAISYRIISALATGSVVFCITQSGRLAAGVTVIDAGIKMLLYYLHERAWMLVRFGSARQSANSGQLGENFAAPDLEVS